MKNEGECRLKLSELPERSHAWIFAANERLSDEASAKLLNRVDTFLAQWASHGQPNVSARELRENRFLIVAADESRSPSGCGIDKLFGLMKTMENELGMSLIDSSRIFYREKSGAIAVATRDAFRKLAEDGRVALDTPVFDISISVVADFLSGEWETRAADSWHSEAFPLKKTASAAV